MATLNNNNITSILNEAYGQAIGDTTIANLTAKDIVDRGQNGDIALTLEQLTKALLNVSVKRWFLDSSYRTQYEDPFFVDSKEFGAITQLITIEAPEVQENPAWQNVVSGSTKIGQYTVYLPIVDATYYGKSVSWELPITISHEQWNTAMEDASQLEEFVAFCMLAVDNAIVTHLENMNAINRNNFMAEKINYATQSGAKGVHVVNLVEAYSKKYLNNTAMTADEYRSNVKAMLDGTARIRLTIQYLKKMSKVYNTQDKKRFVPEDRIVVQLLSEYEEDLNTIAYSDTFNKDVVALPGHQSIPYWQSIDDVDSIDVTIAGDTEIKKSGIVGFIADKWAIIHTIVKQRVASQHFDIEDMTHFSYQFVDRYVNNLSMSAVVFTIEDYTPSV